jgi:hypothetical protein
MTELSPAAEAVLHAVTLKQYDVPYYACPASIDQIKSDAAAALRAAADQAHPKAHIEDIDYVHQSYVDGWKDALDVILAIADELDNTNNTSEKTNGQD